MDPALAPGFNENSGQKGTYQWNLNEKIHKKVKLYLLSTVNKSNVKTENEDHVDCIVDLILCSLRVILLSIFFISISKHCKQPTSKLIKIQYCQKIKKWQCIAGEEEQKMSHVACWMFTFGRRKNYNLLGRSPTLTYAQTDSLHLRGKKLLT